MIQPRVRQAQRRRVAVLAGLLLAATSQAQILLPTPPPFIEAGHAYSFHAHINNVTLAPRDEKTSVIEFDLAWSGSWRHDVNHDAVWIFFKFRTENDPPKGGWRHLFLSADRVLNPTGYGQDFSGRQPTFLKGSETWSAPGDTQFDFLVPVDRTPGPGGAMQEVRAGVFVRRADHGMGSVSGSKLRVLWDLTKSPGVKPDTKVQLKAHDIIMLYVAEAPFYLGSGASESAAFYQTSAEKKQAVEKERIVNGNSTMIIKDREGGDDLLLPPYRVTSSNAIPTGTKPGRLWARGAEPPEDGEIPAAFPSGYKAFYMARYPLVPSHYAQCLDLLQPDVAQERYHPEGFPCHGRISRTPEGAEGGYTYQGFGARKSKALWYMCWADVATYDDWACLRPMTELEFEKALRGPRLPMKEEAGSSFWGGSFGGGRYNAHPREIVVTVATTNGLAYCGTHGSGTATNWPSDWPRKDAKGTGVRGGQEAASGPGELAGPMWCTSSRLDAALADPERFITYGCRPARTAPEEAKLNSVRNEREESPWLQGAP